MRLRFGFAMLVAIAVLACFSMYAQAQDAPAAPDTTAAVPAADIQWLWGEVVTVGGSDMTVKTLDYETDAEKEMKIAVDDKTTFENVKAFAEIKPQDTVAIDYQVMPDGSNVAKNISVERPETLPAPTPEPVAVPDASVMSAPATEPAAPSEPGTPAAPAAPEAPAQSATDTAPSSN